MSTATAFRFVADPYFFFSSAHASWVPDRRKSQFETTFGYALFPYPYSLPGIGQGFGCRRCDEHPGYTD